MLVLDVIKFMVIRKRTGFITDARNVILIGVVSDYNLVAETVRFSMLGSLSHHFLGHLATRRLNLLLLLLLGRCYQERIIVFV